jgi:predicted adenylyl cyclase CyaB
MVKEIELKAHVRDSEALKAILSQKAEPGGAFEKRDVYWFGPETSALPLTKLRVRKEKRSFADGTEKSLCLVTYKAKEENNGIETNEELEFEVNPVEEFEEFLEKAGLKAGAVKRKHGWVFSKALNSEAEFKAADITAELVEVDGLGWFVELEICVKVPGDCVNGSLDEANAKDKFEETLFEAKKRLLAFLDSLGIKREAIERRFYLDMLSSTES